MRVRHATRQPVLLASLVLAAVSLACQSKNLAPGNTGVSSEREVAPPDTAGPSLTQTRQWISERLPELTQTYTAYRASKAYEVPGGIQTQTVAALLDTTCTLRIEQQMTNRTVDFGESHTHYVLRFPLRHVDLGSVHAERKDDGVGQTYSLEPHSDVILSVVGGRKLIEDSIVGRTRKAVETYSTFGIATRDMNAAERIAKAVQRAVLLCGGRKDPF